LTLSILKVQNLESHPLVFVPTKDNVSKLLLVSIEVEIAKKSASAPPVLEVEEKKLDEIVRKSLYKHVKHQ